MHFHHKCCGWSVAPVALALVLQSCASKSMVYEPRVVARGAASGLNIPLTRAFRTAGEFEQFSRSLRSQYEQSDFPPSLREPVPDGATILAIIGGDADADQEVKILRATTLDGTMLVTWRKARLVPDSVFEDSETPRLKPLDAQERIQPFIIVVIPGFQGPVRFLQNRALLDGP